MAWVMGRVFAGGNEQEKRKFEKGGGNDLSAGPVENRRCTDILCIALFVAAQVVFIIVTVAGARDGNPKRLYEPRDYRGAYCGVGENWNNGPSLGTATKLSYTMNVSTTVDLMMKQLVCSTVAKRALVDGDGSIRPLLTNETDQEKYLCDCCLSPCKRCEGSLDKGPDFTTAEGLSATIVAKMAELTDPSKAADLFSPSGANEDMFSTNAFWEQATKYFNVVCLPDCGTDFESINNGTSRNYTYTPAKDNELYGAWSLLLNAAPGSMSSLIQKTIASAFTFKAFPESVCPYEPALCVPMPGMAFEEASSGSDYCTFQMASQVIDAVGEAAASAFESIGGTAMASAATVEFGEWLGDFQKTIDTFVIVCALSFLWGLIFLVLLRFFVGVCVWVAVAITVVMFWIGGAFSFVRSGQCQGASFWDTGRQNVVAVVVAAHTAASNAVNKQTAVSEYMDEDGDGSDYRGVQRFSKNGKPCLMWETQTAMPGYRPANYSSSDLVKNYCRNPYNESDMNKAKTIWCATSDPLIAWEECTPIGIIQPECKRGYAVSAKNMRDALFYGAFVIWALGLIWVIVVLCFAKRIQLAIALNKVAAVFLANNPHALLIPIVQSLFAIGWTIAWLYSVSFLLSQVPDAYTPKGYYATYAQAVGTSTTCAFWEFGDQCNSGTPGACNSKWPAGFAWKDSNCEMDGDVAQCWRCAPPRYALDLRFAVSFFVFLWNNAFNVALGQMLIAMAVGVWFFSAEKGKASVVPRAVRTIFRYHIGSVAFGSFIVAVIQFVRYSMKYLEKQASAQKNRVMVLVLRVLQCVIWCFEKCVQFLNKNAYIQIALLGKPFCTSAKTAFYLILRNALRFGTVAVLGHAIHLIGFLCIMSSTVVCGYFIMRAMHPDISPVMPVMFYFLISYVVAKLYMNVFGLAVDTSLQCFLAVEEMGGDTDFVPSSLKGFVNNNLDKGKDDPKVQI